MQWLRLQIALLPRYNWRNIAIRALVLVTMAWSTWTLGYGLYEVHVTDKAREAENLTPYEEQLDFNGLVVPAEIGE